MTKSISKIRIQRFIFLGEKRNNETWDSLACTPTRTGFVVNKFEDFHVCNEHCVVEYSGIGRPPRPWCERFKDKIVYHENTCWMWKNVIGRGHSERNRLNFSPHVSFQRGSIDACRWIYWMTRGFIEKDLEIDHLCEDWHCVNPVHLQLVTNMENNRRYAKTRSEWVIRDGKGRFAGGNPKILPGEVMSWDSSVCIRTRRFLDFLRRRLRTCEGACKKSQRTWNEGGFRHRARKCE